MADSDSSQSALQKAMQELELERQKCREAELEAAVARAECSVLQARGPSYGAAGDERLAYMASGRKLDRFRNRPEKGRDPTIQEWVADVRGQLATRKLNKDMEAAFILDHLAGKARQEILGRGSSTTSDPEKILAVLLKVFGDGHTLKQLQQKFFSYRQQEDEDLVTCSLKLVDLFDRIILLDPTFTNCREATLKGRLAEAVRDEGLRREIRRLNMDSESLSFFDMRDRAQEWLGQTEPKPVKVTELTLQETMRNDDDILAQIRQQGEQLAAQQDQIERLLKEITSGSANITNANRGRKQRRCWNCGALDHIRRNCPTYTAVNTQGSVSSQALN